MFRKLHYKMSLYVILGVITFYGNVLKLKNWKKWAEETLFAMVGIFYYFIPSAVLWRVFING